MASPQEMQPTVEDCFSDDSEASIPFQGRRSPNAANVSTKRSHPSDLDKEMPPAQERVPTNIDLRSDSGYSSYTTATVSSTNSAQSAPPQRSPPQVPAAPAPPLPDAPKARRRPTQPDTSQTSSKTTSRPKSISRTASVSSKPPAIIQQRERRSTVTQDPRPDRRDRRDSRVEPECADPRRSKYDPNAPAPAPRRRDVRPKIHPSQSARDVTRPSAEDTRSMRSDPTPYHPAPPSPTSARQSYLAHGGAIIQPATTRPRGHSNARPLSYSGEPGAQYPWAGYPNQPQEHGPPLSHSALYRQGYSAQMGPPPHLPYAAAPGYPPAYNYQLPQSYDSLQRPGMPHRNSTNIARNGPAPPPLISQVPRDQYSARHGQPQSATHARFPPMKQLQDQAYESYSGSETASSDEEDYYEPEPELHLDDPRAPRALMPPPPSKLARSKSKSKPKSKSKKLQRPSMPHSYTTSDIDQVRPDRRKSQPVVVVDRTSRHRATQSTNEPYRRQSVSRPPPPPRDIQTEYPARGGQIYVHDSTKAERRRSAHYGKSYNDKYAEYAEARQQEERLAAEANAKAEARARRETRALEERYQAEQERKREKRSSKVYYQPPVEFEDSEAYESDPEANAIPEAPAPPHRRRPTDVDGRKGKERVAQKARRDEMKALEYINNKRGTDVPLNDHIHSAAKRASRAPSIPSHSGSSGSDRQSQSNRTALTSNGNNEIRLRVDANAPLSLQFNGDMEGRTMQLIPGEDGMAELVISGNRENESTYHGSERGSISGDRKALVTRRQAEEMNEGSTRSQRVRRESRVVRDLDDDRIEVQRPLRRRANTNSHYGN